MQKPWLDWLAAPGPNLIERDTPMPIDTDVRIVNSGSTNTLGFTLTLAQNGTATLEQNGTTEQKQLSEAMVANLFATLRASGPLDALPETRCMKSASFGTTTRIVFGGEVSPDISCPSPNTLVRELAKKATAVLDAAGARVVPRRTLTGRPPLGSR
jgi:hypothetical protein